MVEAAIAVIAVIAVSLLVLLSVQADKRFRNRKRLPMQWSLGGHVTWTAPRRVALVFTPALAALVLIGTAVAVQVSGDPKPGQEGFGPPVMLLMAVAFLGAHALHLRMISRAPG
jgi:hypothetical protein